MNFHVIVDQNGELVAWIKGEPVAHAGPRLVILPDNPAHVLHENVEVDVGNSDRAAVVAALQKAVATRVDRVARRPQPGQRLRRRARRAGKT